jgi:hypothetical protein
MVAPEQRSPGVAIPPPAPRPTRPSEPYIDQARLAEVREQTAVVSAMLTDIFRGDESAAAVASAARPASSVPGLDGAHAQLLEALFAPPGMERGAFERKARELRLLADGALEAINDWSFDKFDEPLLEDGEMIVVADHLRPRLQTFLETAQ